MSEFLIILGCAVGFAVMGLLTRGLTHHEHAHNEAALKRSPDGAADPAESCGGCSLQCETTEPDHV